VDVNAAEKASLQDSWVLAAEALCVRQSASLQAPHVARLRRVAMVLVCSGTLHRLESHPTCIRVPCL
jgi:hypothetical protein